MKWSIGHIAQKQAAQIPDKVAFYYEDEPFTYRQLNEQANRLANFMQTQGLRKGDRVSVYMMNCPEFLSAYLAAAKLGLVFVPINFRLLGQEVKYQVNDCGSRLLLFHDRLAEQVDSVRSHLCVDPDKYVFVRSKDFDPASAPPWATEHEEILRSHPSQEPAAEPVELDDPLAIIYTSGVTGDPKGAVLSHQQTYYKNFQVNSYLDLRQDDVLLSQLPLFHSGGLFIVATPALCRGATLIMRQTFEAAQFAADIGRYRATVVLALTTMWRFVLMEKALDRVDVSSVRVVLGGGERTPAGLIRELAERGLHVQTGFGQTENSFMALMPKGTMAEKPGAIGLPGFFTDVWIQKEDGSDAPPGEIGEIVASGPTVMSGYWNLPEKTAGTLVDGVLHTGDLGYKDADGFLYIVDRAKDMYRSGGENVYPAEVEKILADHPAVALVAIVGVPDDQWGETGKAFVVPREGEKPSQGDLSGYLKGRVAKYKIPRHWEFVPELPLTATGKVRKAALKQRYLDA